MARQHQETELTPPRRMVTRSTNADAHPGTRAKEALRARAPARSQDEIAEEKSTKAAVKEAKAVAQALKEAGEKYAIQLQADREVAVKNREKNIPRRRIEKAKGSHKPENSNVTSLNKRKAPEAEVNTSWQISAPAPPQKIKRPKLSAKALKVSAQEKQMNETFRTTENEYAQNNDKANHPRPLRRHETEIRPDELVHTSTKDNREANKTNRLEPNDNFATPRPKATQKEDLRDVDDFSDSDDEFKTPRTLKKFHGKKAITNDQISESESGGSKQVEWQANGAIAESTPADGKQTSTTLRANTSNFPKATVRLNLAQIRDDRAKNLVAWAPQYNTKTYTRPEPRPTNPQVARDHKKRSHIPPEVQVTGTLPHRASSVRPVTQAVVQPPVPVQVDVAHVMANAVPRKTLLNPIIASKDAPATATMSKKYNKAREPEPKLKPDHIRNTAIGGLDDDEDETLEEEAAISSPMRGAEARGASKKLIKSKRKGVEDLPMGAKDKATWQAVVMPNFMGLLLGGSVPWKITDRTIEETLSKVCKHTYGERIKLEVTKGSVAFDIAAQTLTNYRSKFATAALPATLTHLARLLDIQDIDLDVDGPALAELAEDLRIRRHFIFKGCENLEKMKETGRFENVMVLDVFAAHFNKHTVGRNLKGIEINRPNCALALAAAAVERALELTSKQLIKQTTNAKGKKKYSVIPTMNPLTGKLSTASTDFSTDNWNNQTVIMLTNIQSLDDKRFHHIFNLASTLSHRRNHLVRPKDSDFHLQEEDIILSEEESGDNNPEEAATTSYPTNQEYEDEDDGVVYLEYEEDDMDFE